MFCASLFRASWSFPGQVSNCYHLPDRQVIEKVNFDSCCLIIRWTNIFRHFKIFVNHVIIYERVTGSFLFIMIHFRLIVYFFTISQVYQITGFAISDAAINILFHFPFVSLSTNHCSFYPWVSPLLSKLWVRPSIFYCHCPAVRLPSFCGNGRFQFYSTHIYKLIGSIMLYIWSIILQALISAILDKTLAISQVLF